FLLTVISAITGNKFLDQIAQRVCRYLLPWHDHASAPSRDQTQRTCSGSSLGSWQLSDSQIKVWCPASSVSRCTTALAQYMLRSRASNLRTHCSHSYSPAR